MDKQLEFWRDKCLESKLNLNTQLVEETNQSEEHNQKIADTKLELERKIKEIKKDADDLKS